MSIRVCPVTNLAIIVDPPAAMWRVFNTQYGPLNPPIGLDGDQRNRFDCPDTATLYGADQRKGAFEEVLAYFESAQIVYQEFFDDLSPEEDPVRAEWEEAGMTPTDADIRLWISGKRLARLALNPNAEYVDVLAGDTIGALRAAAPDWAPDGFRTTPNRIDISALTGSNRSLTCSAAHWIRTRTLHNGAEPSGLKYLSKHGSDLTCWVVWVPMLGVTDQSEVQDIVERHLSLAADSAIDLNDPDLSWAIGQLPRGRSTPREIQSRPA